MTILWVMFSVFWANVAYIAGIREGRQQMEKVRSEDTSH